MSDCIVVKDELYVIYPNYRTSTLDAEYCSRYTYYLKKGNYFFLNDEGKIVDSNEQVEDKLAYKIGRLEGNYYCFDNEIFGLQHTFRIDVSLIDKLQDKHFLKYPSRLSILKEIDSLINEDFYILPDDTISEEVSSISWTEYNNLVDSFPTTTTVKHYIDKLVAEKIEGFFELKKNYDDELEKHLQKTNRITSSNTLFSKELDYEVTQAEISKFTYALDLLKYILEQEIISEKEWQNKILDILLLIYPQYQIVIDEVGLSNRRRVDFILVDLFNNIDIVEIKTPEKKLLKKSKYRDHYVPSHEFTGTAMQIEYYLRELHENSSSNIQKIKSKLLDKSFESEVKINNVKGIIIMGRTNGFNAEQQETYRIMKNQFSNIINIISYDELLDMLERILNRFTKIGISNKQN